MFQPVKPTLKSLITPSLYARHLFLLHGLHANSPVLSVSYRKLLPPHVGLPGLWLQDEHASRTEMSVDSLEEPLEATVPPVQVNPFGNAQAHDHVVLWPLSQKKIIVLQYVIGLKERRGAVRKTGGANWPTSTSGKFQVWNLVVDEQQREWFFQGAGQRTHTKTRVSITCVILAIWFLYSSGCWQRCATHTTQELSRKNSHQILLLFWETIWLTNVRN